MRIYPRQKQESARDYALRVLKANIISLDLAPGAPVSENELSEALGISRTPVREAIIELSRYRIIESVPQKKTYVAPINEQLIEEARLMRCTMETAVVALACTGLPEEAEERLKRNLAVQKFCLENGMGQELLETDNEFHRTFFEVTQNMEIWSLMQDLAIHFDRVRNMSISTIPDLKIVQDHEAILAAVKAHDSDTAVDLIRKHLTRYRFDAAVIRENYPQYFG